MAAIASTSFGTIANEHLTGVIQNIMHGSTVAALSGQEPMRFGTGEIVELTAPPKAEFVAEGAEKSETPATLTTVKTAPHKAQVTIRMNEEVQWADEDYQLQAVSTLVTHVGNALSRALDLGLYYRLNPLSGTPTAWTNYLNTTTNRVEIGAGNLDEYIEDAVSEIIGVTPVNGIALTPGAAFTLSTLRDNENRKLYPDLGFGQGISQFLGLNAAVSTTVSSQPEAADNGVRAIVGDFAGGIRWGIQREIPIELIRFGDPDGQGDLKRKNQVALRAEVLYAWYVDADRFAVVEDQES